LYKSKKINRQGSIITISSISSLLGVPGTLLYSASKGALNSSIKVLANEFSVRKIRVNAITPGIVVSEMTKNNDKINFDLLKSQEVNYPLGFGSPNDVSGPVIFHLSDQSKWLTGNIMVLDGGFMLN